MDITAAIETLPTARSYLLSKCSHFLNIPCFHLGRTYSCVGLHQGLFCSPHVQTGRGTNPAFRRAGNSVLSIAVKRSRRKTDGVPPPSAVVKNTWSRTSTPCTSSCRGNCMFHVLAVDVASILALPPPQPLPSVTA